MVATNITTEREERSLQLDEELSAANLTDQDIQDMNLEVMNTAMASLDLVGQVKEDRMRAMELSHQFGIYLWGVYQVSSKIKGINYAIKHCCGGGNCRYLSSSS